MLKRAQFLENNQNCKADLPWVQWHCIIQRLGTVHTHLMYPQYLHIIFKGTTEVSKKIWWIPYLLHICLKTNYPPMLRIFYKFPPNFSTSIMLIDSYLPINLCKWLKILQIM